MSPKNPGTWGLFIGHRQGVLEMRWTHMGARVSETGAWRYRGAAVKGSLPRGLWPPGSLAVVPCGVRTRECLPLSAGPPAWVGGAQRLHQGS